MRRVLLLGRWYYEPGHLEGAFVLAAPRDKPATLAAGAVALPLADGVMRRLGLPQD
jgi:hypothetical protein